MATTIKIRSTTTTGKVPSTSDIEVSELALNLADQKLYSRNAAGIFEIGKPGETPSGGTGDRPGSPELGDLYFDTTLDALLYWDGGSWVPVGAGAVALNDLTDVDTTGVTNGMVIAFNQADSTWKPVSPASLSVDVDLGYTPAADKGTVTNTAGDNAELPAATTAAAGLFVAADKQKLDGIEAGAQVNPDLGTYLQSGDNISELVNDANYVTSADIGDGTITITKSDGSAVGSFTVNQAGDTSIALPADVVPSAPGDGKLTIKDSEGTSLGEFTANQATGVDTEITLPAIPEVTGFVKLDDEGTEQSITGGGGLDVAGGITSEFGTSAAQLGNVAPLNDWSCYPPRTTIFRAPPTPPPAPAPEPVDPGFGVDQPSFGSGQILSGGLSSAGLIGTQDIVDLEGE